MAYNVIVGRDEDDRAKFGTRGTIYLGKQYVKMGQTTSLSNKVFMDVARAHVVLVSGKRGSGKSYSLSVMAEEMCRLPKEISKRLSILFFDTMGIFWTMKYPNDKQEDLLREWELSPEGLNVRTYVPIGHFNSYKDAGMPVDYPFAIRTSELDPGDWCNVFGLKANNPSGILIERAIERLEGKEYSIDNILEEIKNDKRVDSKIKDAVENRFEAAKGWGLFSEEGTRIKDLIKPGRASILDVSCYTTVSGSWSVKSLVIGLISRKLLNERIAVRKVEEINTIRGAHIFEEEEEIEMPLVWILIDEAHNFLPREEITPATDALVQLLREGRQPGISLVLATQQPGEIKRDVLTQSDIVISHNVTAKVDIEALNSMMQTYLIADIQKYLNELPKLKGSAIVLDDNSERIYPIRVHPKRSWHGGEAPTAIKPKKFLGLEL